jgi:heme-degrading monooxygenase HmoA
LHKAGIEVRLSLRLISLQPSTPIPVSAPVIGVARCFVEKEKKGDFDRLFKAGLSDLEKFTPNYPCFGGWRIDKEGEDEEFVLLTGWSSVEHHEEFYKSELSKEFAKTKSFIKKTEVKHVRLEDWA